MLLFNNFNFREKEGVFLFLIRDKSINRIEKLWVVILMGLISEDYSFLGIIVGYYIRVGYG